MLANGKGIEINTSGLRSACNEALPGIWYAKVYIKNVVVKSSLVLQIAHFTKDVGFHIKESYELLKDLGYKIYIIPLKTDKPFAGKSYFFSNYELWNDEWWIKVRTP